MSKHTPEPWGLEFKKSKFETGIITDTIRIAEVKHFSDYKPFTTIHECGELIDPLYEEGIANAKRIVECVNALAGISDPKLEIEALRQMQKDYATKSADLIMARAENERLREELKAIANECDQQNESHETIWQIAHYALKGETT
jgi:hypothetical protein